MKFDQHTLVLLVRPPDAPELSEQEANALQDAHLAFRADLRDQGYLIAGGPLLGQDDERLRGISVMSVDPATARELCSADPAVRAGRLAVQVMTWMVPAGKNRLESGDSRFAPGDTVVGQLGWQEYAVTRGGTLRKIDPRGAPAQTALHVLGV